MEGTEIDKEGDVIMGLTRVRKRGSNGQVEKEVATREERRNAFKLKYPYLIRFWSDEEIEKLMEESEERYEQEEKVKKKLKEIWARRCKG